MNAGWTYRELVGSSSAGLTVLAHFVRWHDHSTEAEWRARVEAGEVRLGERVALASDVLRPGDALAWSRAPWEEPPAPLHFEVIFEDEDLLAVAKPSGLPTMPGAGFLEHTLLALVRARDPSASPMHRLGRGTSGLVLFARTERAGAALQAAWRDRKVRKVYRALASGRVDRDAFDIDTPIGPVPHPVLGEIHAASARGKRSKSHVQVVARESAGTFVDVEIETGRPHQIRIHLASVGHPLVGDSLYVAGGGARADALPGDLGYLLHARLLAFAHPRTGAPMSLECPPPGSLVPAESA